MRNLCPKERVKISRRSDKIEAWHQASTSSTPLLYLTSSVTYFFAFGVLIALMMEEVNTSETSVSFDQTTRRNIPRCTHHNADYSRKVVSVCVLQPITAMSPFLVRKYQPITVFLTTSKSFGREFFIMQKGKKRMVNIKGKSYQTINWNSEET
jgi:hypothetical protein